MAAVLREGKGWIKARQEGFLHVSRTLIRTVNFSLFEGSNYVACTTESRRVLEHAENVVLLSQLTSFKPSFLCQPFLREIPTPPPRNHLVPFSWSVLSKDDFFSTLRLNRVKCILHWVLLEPCQFTYPSICHWVFKDEEVSVLQPVSRGQIMECGAESKSEKKIRSPREDGRE